MTDNPGGLGCHLGWPELGVHDPSERPAEENRGSHG